MQYAPILKPRSAGQPVSRSAGSRVSGQWVLCLILLLATVLIYLNSFPGAFHFDDFALMLENPHVTDKDFRYGSFLDLYGGRPLTLWTFYVNYQLFGADPFSYHAISVALHGFAAVGIFFLLLQLFQERFLAFAAALIFAFHPLQTQAVNYVWSRSVLLMTCFAVLALLTIQKRPLLALLLFQLAIWSRAEAIAFVPLVIFLHKPRWKAFALLAAGNTLAFAYSLWAYSPRDVGWNHPEIMGYWLSQPVAFWRYAGLLFWPAGLSIDHDLARPEWAGFLGASLALLALAAAAFQLRKRYPVPAVSMLWIGITLAPSWLVASSDLVNESRLYVAMGGFSLLAAWVLSQRSRLLVLPLLLLMCPLTYARNELWKDDVALWRDAARKSPVKARAHYNLGAALARSGEVEEAEEAFRRARRLNPKDDLSYAALGYCAEKRGDWKQAQALYRRALQLNSDNSYAKARIK